MTGKSGRPIGSKCANPRTVRKIIRWTPEEWAEVQRRAAGKDVSKWQRWRILKSPQMDEI